MKRRNKRMIAIALLVALCAVISSLVTPQPILNKGIVVGMGVDKTEDDRVEVTIQIAVAGESSAPGAPNRYAVVSGQASTLLSAMEDISRILAYKPAYFHCHMLVLGEKLVKEGVREIATQLFIEDSLMDDVAVMAVRGTAKETLERSVSVQGAAAIYLQQLNKINSTTGGHPTATLKSFVTKFETKGYTPYLPWVEAVPVPKAIGGADTGGDEQNYAFDCSKTVLFDDEGRGKVEDERVTVAIGLTGQSDGMQLPVSTEKGSMDVYIKKSLEWWSIRRSGKTTLSALYFVKVIATDVGTDPSALSDDFVKKAVEREISDTLLEVYDLGRAHGRDPYSLAGKYHKVYGKKRKPTEEAFEVKVKVRLSDV